MGLTWAERIAGRRGRKDAVVALARRLPRAAGSPRSSGVGPDVVQALRRILRGTRP
jgi:hypothetical protein